MLDQRFVDSLPVEFAITLMLDIGKLSEELKGAFSFEISSKGSAYWCDVVASLDDMTNQIEQRLEDLGITKEKTYNSCNRLTDIIDEIIASKVVPISAATH